MSRTKADREQYIELYDKYSTMYEDPIKVMFEIMSAKVVEPGVRRAAAADLIGYRFPKTKAIDINATLNAQATFSFQMIAHQDANLPIEQKAPNIIEAVVEPLITDFIPAEVEFAGVPACQP